MKNDTTPPETQDDKPLTGAADLACSKLFGACWSVSPVSQHVIELPSHEYVCALENSDESRSFARGVFISAAPDMYRALKAIMEYHGPGTLPDDLFEAGNEALIRAESFQPNGHKIAEPTRAAVTTQKNDE